MWRNGPFWCYCFYQLSDFFVDSTHHFFCHLFDLSIDSSSSSSRCSFESTECYTGVRCNNTRWLPCELHTIHNIIIIPSSVSTTSIRGNCNQLPRSHLRQHQRIGHWQLLRLLKRLSQDWRCKSRTPWTLFARFDFFGNRLPSTQEMSDLMMPPANRTLFSRLIETCLVGIVGRLRRQYQKYFTTVAGSTDADLTSAMQQTMLAKSIIGEFSEMNKWSPNASINSINNRLKGKRNHVRDIYFYVHQYHGEDGTLWDSFLLVLEVRKSKSYKDSKISISHGVFNQFWKSSS